MYSWFTGCSPLYTKGPNSSPLVLPQDPLVGSASKRGPHQGGATQLLSGSAGAASEGRRQGGYALESHMMAGRNSETIWSKSFI